MAKFRLLFLLTVVAGIGVAEVKLPSLLGDHMVLQRDLPIHIWGWADPAEKVEVQLGEASASTAAGRSGDWEVYLPPRGLGDALELTIAGSNRITLKDVRMGDVWVGSGQSNMVWPVARSINVDREIAEAYYPRIRLFKVALKTADEVQNDVEGEWLTCNGDTVENFSAVGYFFARNLHERTNIPIGIIQSAWGGTPAEAWTTRGTLDSNPSLQRFLAEWRQTLDAYPKAKAAYDKKLAQYQASGEKGRRPAAPRGPGHPHSPAGLYNAMIAPLTPFPIKGFLWYQGENNASRGHGASYAPLFRSMIEDWRRDWGIGDLPFLFVQLANYGRVPEASTWPEVREAQADALGLRNTAMAVTIDVGNPDNIHPKNKQAVGLRLSLAARAIVYGEGNLVYSGPVFRQATREGSRLRVWFDSVGSGLEARDGELVDFEVADGDGEFKPAKALIEGASVVLTSEEVSHPVEARYAWSAAPTARLFNSTGLPASPFRTKAR